jgi:general secretion pathway protein L
LEELTRLLPDGAWVTDLKMDANTVEIAGLASSSTSLIPLLERSTAFTDATSTASLTFDPREEKERYAIRARIRSSAPAVPLVGGTAR